MLCFGLLYTGVAWAVLFLWEELFGLIGIDFFEELFSEDAFAFPVTGGAVGYGLAVGRESESTIATLRGLTQSLFRTLLPVVLVVTLGFAASLPFTGLGLLFETGSAASILISWLAALVLFVNAVYLDGSSPPPYRTTTRRLVEVGMLVAPLLGVIALLAIAQRVDQYGLTPERIFAGVFACVLTLYVGGYGAAVVQRGEPWLPSIRRVNLAMAWVLVVLAFALHTPLADPLAWSVSNQVGRLRDGVAAVESFDFGQLRFQLGWRGAQALDEIESHPPAGLADPVRARIRLVRDAQSYYEWSENLVEPFVLEERFVRLVAGTAWPEGLVEWLPHLSRTHHRLGQCGSRGRCVAFSLDLDGDGRVEELIAAEPSHHWMEVVVLTDNDGWRVVGTYRRRSGRIGVHNPLGALREGRFQPVPRSWPDLEIDGQKFDLDLD